MQKRKAKFNILDVAIVLTVICAIAVLGFRHYIVEFFDEPQIQKTFASVTISNVTPETGWGFKEGDTVEFYPRSDGDEKVGAKIKKITFNKNNTASVELELKGYTKFGRIYSEKGEHIKEGHEFVITKGENKSDCVIKSVKIG